MKQTPLKNYLKLGSLLLGISLIIYNCQTDDVTFNETNVLNVKTVSFEEARAFFQNNTSNNSAFAQRNSSEELILNPDWSTLQHSDLAYTDAELTKAVTEVNRTGDYESKLIFLNINNVITSVIITTWVTDYDSYGNILNAITFINRYDGTFVDAYKIEQGLFTKRLVPRPAIQTAGFFALLQDIVEPSDENGSDFWNCGYLGGELDEVDLGNISSNNGGGNPASGSGGNYSPGLGQGQSYGSYINGAANGSGGGGTPGAGITGTGVDTALAATVLNPPSDNNTLEEEAEIERNRRCDQLGQIIDNGNFSQRMQELKTATTGNKEILYYGIRDDNGNMNYAEEDRLEGSGGSHGVPTHTIDNPVDSMIHNHFFGGLPIFSPGDLYSLYELFIHNRIVDTSTFIMFVVTPGNNLNSTADDTLYAITISDITQFQVNGALFLTDEKGIGAFFNDIGINPNISVSPNEQKFLQVINGRNLGLTLYKGNPNDLSSWSQLKLRNNETIQEKNCN